jgi:L-amino acid N-acyltransferase YncA
VNVLAVPPERRGRGLGSLLVALAGRIARVEELAALGPIVGDDNPGALRLHARHGFAERARRPAARDGWDADAQEWMLMLRELED